MSSPSLPSISATAAPNAPRLSQDQFVDRQLGRVTQHVKATELLGATLELLCAVLGSISAFVLVDHWLMDVGRVGRGLALVLFVGLVAGLAFGRLWPLVWRRINPAYAARVVEEAQPSLKNSLLNLVFLRRHREQVHELVYRELEHDAATQLTRLSPESVVDRSRIVVWTFCLATLVVFFTAYSSFSSKDILASLRRLFVPWSLISRPSRVELLTVRPGDTDIYEGRHLAVDVEVEQLGPRDEVWIEYSTQDGQYQNHRVRLKKEKDNEPFRDRYRQTIPESTTGIVSHLTYSVHAGDASAGPFQVRVRPEPSAVIEKIEYSFPPYTQLAPQEVIGSGDLEAVEGTRVKIHVRANQDIQQAFLELGSEFLARIPLQGAPRRQYGEWTLLLNPERTEAQHTSYRIRMQNLAGDLNPEPVVYRVKVIPDLPPTVEILNPAARETTLAQDSQLTVEIRALDPDFELADLRLLGLSEGRHVLNEALLTEPAAGQVLAKYELVPSRLGLQAGDLLVLWAQAEDNRCDPVSSAPAPNKETTIQHRIRILPPKEPSEGPRNERPGEQAPRTKESQPSEESEQQNGAKDSQQTQDGSAGEAEAGDASGESKQSTQGQDQQGPGTAQGESPQKDPQGGARSGTQADGANSPDPKDQDPQQGSAESTPSDATDNARSPREGREDRGDERPEPGAAGERSTGQDGKQTESKDQKSPETGDAEQDDAEQSPAQEGTPSETTDGGQTKEGDRQPSSKSDQQSMSKEGKSKEVEKSGGIQRDTNSGRGEMPQDQPLADDGSQDGDAFERILKEIQRKQNEAQSPEPASRETSPQSDRRPGGNSASDSGSGDDSRASADQADSGEAEDRDPSASAGDPSREQDQSQTPNPSDPPEGARQSSGSDGQNGATNDGQNGATSDGQNGATNEARNGTTSDEQNGARKDGQNGATNDGQNGGATDGQDGATSDGQDGAKGDRSDGSDPQQGSSEPNGSRPPNDSNRLETADRSNRSEGAPSANPSSWPQGGEPGNGTGSLTSDFENNDNADAANLEYARKATELVLEYLKKQQNEPDPDLLNKLGWTKEDLQKFIERWENFKREADEPSVDQQAARNKLDELLRGLGLQPDRDRARQDRYTTQRTEVTESGQRSPPPDEYAEQYRAFLRGRQP